METPIGDKPIKIGFSVNVEMRISALACGSPYPATLLGFWETACGDLEEREIHKTFADARLEGEWFTPTSALIEFIEERVRAYRSKLEERSRQLAGCSGL